jgi:diacylglycerol kinase family enzyme
MLGILPAGSANGLAKELGISDKPEEALQLLVDQFVKKIHVTMVNKQMCIHLSDVGFNAFVVKEFDSQKGRGMWGYLKASVKVLFKNPHLKVEMDINNETIRREAAMIVIANATKYGSGALINPEGKLDDELFEVVAIKKVSFSEIFKMVVSHAKHDKTKTETFQTNRLRMRIDKKRFFQVDGEFLGKVDQVEAELIPNALSIVVPRAEQPANFN